MNCGGMTSKNKLNEGLMLANKIIGYDYLELIFPELSKKQKDAYDQRV